MMTYAYEGGVSTEAREGAISITAEQYAEAIAGMQDGLLVSIIGGFGLVEPPDNGEDGGTNTDPLTMPITRRQLRLTLVRNNIPLSSVETAIAAMPDGLAKEEAQIEWADAGEFRRQHPTLLLIAAALSLSEQQIDDMWSEAVRA